MSWASVIHKKSSPAVCNASGSWADFTSINPQFRVSEPLTCINLSSCRTPPLGSINSLGQKLINSFQT